MTATRKLPQFGKGARTTCDARGDVVEVLAARYRKGVSVRASAERFGRSYGWARGVLAESGVQFLQGGGNTHQRGTRAGC